MWHHMSHLLTNPLAKVIPVAEPNKNEAKKDILCYSGVRVGAGRMNVDAIYYLVSTAVSCTMESLESLAHSSLLPSGDIFFQGSGSQT